MKEFKFKVDGKDYAASVEEQENGLLQVTVNGKAYQVEPAEKKAVVSRPVVRPAAAAAPAAAPVAAAAPKSTGGKCVTSPLPGTVTKVLVSAGQQVNAGDTVMLLEAMKMENSITAEFGGTVKAILVQQGAQVQEGDALIEMA